MAKVEPNETTEVLAQLAQPGSDIPPSRYDQLIQKPGSIHGAITEDELFGITLTGLGYLDEISQGLLVSEAKRLTGSNILTPAEVMDVLGHKAEIVTAYNALYMAVGDRYERMFDDLLIAGRRFAFGAVATAKIISVELYDAS